MVGPVAGIGEGPGGTPLHRAIAGGVVSDILRALASVGDGYALCCWQVPSPNSLLHILLFSCSRLHRVNVDAGGTLRQTPLHEAINTGSRGLVDLLLLNGGKVSSAFVCVVVRIFYTWRLVSMVVRSVY